MDEEIDPLRVPDQVLRDASISREHHGATAVVHAEAERWPHRRVIDFECRDAHVAVVVNHTFANDMRRDRRADGRVFLDEIAADMNVVREKLLHCIGELLNATRPVKWQRRSLAPELP